VTTPAYLAKPAPELFRIGQVITQTKDGAELARVVTDVHEQSVEVSTPAAPLWGLQLFVDDPARSPHYAGTLADLLPPNVGTLSWRGLPPKNRDLVRRLGEFVVAQRLDGVRVGCTDKLDGPLTHATVTVPARYDVELVFDLLMAYAPYRPLEFVMARPVSRYQASRLIKVVPKLTAVAQ
jgi:hypothetical protein